MGGVSLAEDYPHLFNMVISGNSILSGGSCKIEGGIVVLFMNLIFNVWIRNGKKEKGQKSIISVLLYFSNSRHTVS